MNSLTLTSGDVQTASEILVASAAALAARGQPLWPPQSLTPERLKRHYPDAGWRVAWQEDQAVGTFVMLDKDDLFWPDDAPGTALYLHKLAVHPSAQGSGLARLLLSEAVEETRRVGAPFLRLDTASDRAKLRALYEDFGFETAGERQVGAYHVVLYSLTV
ncbi:GNAT family N-acetyltransferase [Deinococcus oregonensis]|uniref:GNAT family N-acetyltransferase n=1 Tax=Deinococcus oregonensis TaxID=1805970 RepID=A0ABV6B6Y3_9DEIO